MKKNQIIIISIIVVLTALIYIKLVLNTKKPADLSKEDIKTEYVAVKEVQNISRNVRLTSYGQITPNATIDVSVEVQGKLKKGDVNMKPGVKFSKNQVLYRVDNEEAYYSLTARKTQFANMILNALPDIEYDFPSQKKKWTNYMDQITPDRALPNLPQISENKEKMFITSRGIMAEYYNLKSAEARLAKYFYSAPFSGTVIEIYSEPGAIVNPGGRIATIAKTGDYEVRIPINLNNLKSFQSETKTSFTNSSGETIASGKILRISDVINKNTQSVDVYYSISPIKGQTIYNGMFVNAEISQEAVVNSMTIPRSAVNKGSVMILKGNKLEVRKIDVVGSKPDSVFVTGLKDKELVLYELIEDIDKMKKYLGVKRK